MSFDLALFMLVNALAGRGPALDWFIVFFAETLPYLLIILLGHLLFLRSQKPLRERIYVLLYAIATATFARFAITGVIWQLYERPRPFLSHDVNQLLFVDAPSFPSGHSTFMFAFSTVIYLYDKRLGALMFAGSTLIVLSRIAASVHYPTDILGGIIIGAVTGYIAFLIAKRTFLKSPKPPHQD